MNNENLLYYSYDDIEKQAKEFGFNFDSILEFEGYKFYCPEWTYYISKENDCYKIVCQSKYTKMELTDTEISRLYENTMIDTLKHVFVYSKNISDVYFVFMLFHLWQNYIYFAAIYDYKFFGSSQIKVGKTTLIWDNREKEFSVTKIGFFVKNKRYDMKQIVNIVKSIHDIMFSKEAKTGYRSRILNVQQSREMTYLHEELSPEFKKELNDKNIEIAKKQLLKKYQGFRMESNAPHGYIFYIKSGKVIVTDYERGFNNTIILSQPDLIKWTYPDDKYLTPTETSEMQKDLKEFEEKEKLIVEF